MYYLRQPAKEVYSKLLDRVVVIHYAVFKHHDKYQFYRLEYPGGYRPNIKLYRVKSLPTILKVRKLMYEQISELFDVWDGDGIVHGEWEA